MIYILHVPSGYQRLGLKQSSIGSFDYISLMHHYLLTFARSPVLKFSTQYLSLFLIIKVLLCAMYYFKYFIFVISPLLGPPWWLSSEEFGCQCRRRGFDSWVRKILQRSKWQLAPVFLPGISYGQRSLDSYSPRGCKVLDMTEQLSTQSLLLPQEHLFHWHLK